MDNYKNENSLKEKFMENPVIFLTFIVFFINLAFFVLDEDCIIMKKVLFLLNDNFYLEYIARFIRASIFTLCIIIYFIYIIFFEKGFDTKKSRIIVSTIILIPLIISVVYVSSYIKDFGTVKNNRDETCIVNNYAVGISKGKKGNYYCVLVKDGETLRITSKQYRFVKAKNLNGKVCVNYLKNSKVVLKVESSD